MPAYISAIPWSDLSSEELAAIQEHAAAKALEPVDWDLWLNNYDSASWDIPYSVVEALNPVLEKWSGVKRWHKLCFVPYYFNYHLSPTIPAPPEFWRDELKPKGWKQGQTLTVIEAVWVHTQWYGFAPLDYIENAERGAKRFDEEFESLKNGNPEERYRLASQYIEVALMKCLTYGIDHNLPVVITG